MTDESDRPNINDALRRLARDAGADSPAALNAARALLPKPEPEAVDGAAFTAAVRRLARPAGSFGAALRAHSERQVQTTITAKPIRKE